MRNAQGVPRERLVTGNGAGRRAKGLGLLSLGLGVAQLWSPAEVARLIGAPGGRRTRLTMQGLGLREVGSGLAILLQRQPTGVVWARLAGDLLDLALLTRRIEAQRDERRRTRLAIAAVVAVTVLDAVSALQLTRRRRQVRALPQTGFHVTRAITINRGREEVYRFWRTLENLPKFIAHLEAVHTLDGISHWRARAPAATPVEWDAELSIDRPNEAIAWRSLEGASVPNHGLVRFVTAPGNRGTEVRVDLDYRPPAGIAGVTLATLFGDDPGQQLEADLRRLKQVLETGEVVHSGARESP